MTVALLYVLLVGEAYPKAYRVGFVMFVTVRR